MSNELAIATVTATLRNLIDQGVQNLLEGGSVTARPPDKARENGDGSNQINLFLYQTLVNAHWRNRNMPTQVRSGETGRSPLALNLYYLMTAYGRDNEDILGHQLLGRAMRVLHDNSTLKSDNLRLALEDSDLHDQIERVRITPVAMTLEEISKLWATFQTQYRISAAYEASVVLIDSKVPTRAPLPVLMRGNEDRGALVQPNLLPPYPILSSIELPNQQASSQGGDAITFKGFNLDSDSGQVQVLFDHARRDTPLRVDGQSQPSGKAIDVTVPDLPRPWLAGFYTVTMQLQRQGREEESNALSIPLAPRITTPPQQEMSDDGEPLLTITCQPEIQQGQQVFALLGHRSLPLLLDEETFPNNDPSPGNNPPSRTNQLRFNLTGILPGEYWLRLRVDGVDSLLVDRSSSPPTFNPQWRISVS